MDLTPKINPSAQFGARVIPSGSGGNSNFIVEQTKYSHGRETPTVEKTINGTDPAKLGQAVIDALNGKLQS